MSDLPSDDGDEDSQSHGLDKDTSSNADRNAKKTKNAVGMDNDKGDPKSPPNSKVNAIGMEDLKSASTDALVNNKEGVTIV
jgi:hypothetical protein